MPLTREVTRPSTLERCRSFTVRRREGGWFKPPKRIASGLRPGSPCQLLPDIRSGWEARCLCEANAILNSSINSLSRPLYCFCLTLQFLPYETRSRNLGPWRRQQAVCEPKQGPAQDGACGARVKPAQRRPVPASQGTGSGSNAARRQLAASPHGCSCALPLRRLQGLCGSAAVVDCRATLHLFDWGSAASQAVRPSLRRSPQDRLGASRGRYPRGAAGAGHPAAARD